MSDALPLAQSGEQLRLCSGGSRAPTQTRPRGERHSPGVRPLRHGKNTTRVFDGKLLKNQDGAATQITTLEFAAALKLRVERTERFTVGDTLYHYDVRPGDRAAVLDVWQGSPE